MYKGQSTDLGSTYIYRYGNQTQFENLKGKEAGDSYRLFPVNRAGN